MTKPPPNRRGHFCPIFRTELNQLTREIGEGEIGAGGAEGEMRRHDTGLCRRGLGIGSSGGRCCGLESSMAVVAAR
ncbi:hypothetical protein M0R45_019773 [Rubus argutus]|uniref:Uncharacterized protein n=1 Tax=Rubus argutus TaxID=59490 RepID=A0AAW1X7R6_RUBAR